MNKTTYMLSFLMLAGICLLVFGLTASAEVYGSSTDETIYINGGSYDIEDVYAETTVTDAMLWNQTGGVYLSNYTIQVNSTGELVLDDDYGCTWLKLNDSDANNLAYIRVIGKLYANDTMITSWNITEEANSTDWTTFRPYIYIAPVSPSDDTHAEFNNCNIGYLGYNANNKYGIVYEDVEEKDPTGHIHDCTIVYNHIGTVFQGCDYMWINNTDYDESYYGGMVWTVSDNSAEGSDYGGAQHINITDTGGATSADGMRTLGSDKMDFDYVTIDTVTNGGDGWHMDTEGNTIYANNFTISECAGWGINVYNPVAGFTSCVFYDFALTNCTEGGVNFSDSSTNSFNDFNMTGCVYGFNLDSCHNDTFNGGVIEYTTDATDSYGFYLAYIKDTAISNFNISSMNYSMYFTKSGSDLSHDIDVDNTTFYQIGNEGAVLRDDTYEIDFYDMTVDEEDPDCGTWASAFYTWDAENISFIRGTISNVGGGLDVGGAGNYIYMTDYIMQDVGYAGWLIDGNNVTVDNSVYGEGENEDTGWGVYLNTNNYDLTFDGCTINAYSPAVYAAGNNSQGVFNNTWLTSEENHVVNAQENSTLYFYNCTGFWNKGSGATDKSFHIADSANVTIIGFYALDREVNLTTSGYNYNKEAEDWVEDGYEDIEMYNFSLVPSANYVFVNVSVYGTSSVEWTLNSTGAVTVAHTFNDLSGYGRYYPYRDNSRYGSRVEANAQGTLSWTYSGSWSEHNFELQTYSNTYDETTSNLLDNVIPILIAVVALIMIIGLLFTVGVTIESLMAVLVLVILMIVTLQIALGV